MKTDTHQEPAENEAPLVSVFCSADQGDILFDDDQIAVLLQSCTDPSAADTLFDSVRDHLFSLLFAADNLFKQLKQRSLLSQNSEADPSHVSIEISLTGGMCAFNFPPAVFEELTKNKALAELFDTIQKEYRAAAGQFSRIVEDAAGGAALSRETSVIQSQVTVDSWYST